MLLVEKLLNGLKPEQAICVQVDGTSTVTEFVVASFVDPDLKSLITYEDLQIELIRMKKSGRLFQVTIVHNCPAADAATWKAMDELRTILLDEGYRLNNDWRRS